MLLIFWKYLLTPNFWCSAASMQWDNLGNSKVFWKKQCTWFDLKPYQTSKNIPSSAEHRIRVNYLFHNNQKDLDSCLIKQSHYNIVDRRCSGIFMVYFEQIFAHIVNRWNLVKFNKTDIKTTSLKKPCYLDFELVAIW